MPLFETPIIIMFAIIIFISLLMTFLLSNTYKKVKQSEAIVVTGPRGTMVSFNGVIVIPVFDRYEKVDLTIKIIELEKTGRDFLLTRDNVPIDIKTSFFIAINKTTDDVKQAVTCIGADNSYNLDYLKNHFERQFKEALRMVVNSLPFNEIHKNLDRLKLEVLQMIGTELDGFALYNLTIDYLEKSEEESNIREMYDER